MAHFYDPGPLRDGELVLRLESRTPGRPAQARAPAYRFRMEHRDSQQRLGTIDLRVGNGDHIIRHVGHIGYRVEPEHRGHRYAARSCRLLLPLARRHGLETLWIMCAPDNAASRRTCEIAGARFVETVSLPEGEAAAHAGRRLCRYRLDPWLTEPYGATIRQDFDRIARLDEPAWNHNIHYHGVVLRALPETIDDVLEIGCGTGTFTTALAARARRVLAVDLSPAMVEAASRRTADLDNVTVQRANALTMPLPRATYDAVVSIATFHHLPLGRMLRRLRPTLRPGGFIVLLDLYEERTLLDRLVGLAAIPVNTVLSIANLGWRGPSMEAADAWRSHAPHETYRPLREVRRLARQALPGARVRRHLLWRYSLVWRKPTGVS